MRIETPGGWFCDSAADGRYVHLVRGSHLSTSFGRVDLPNGQDLLYIDLAPNGNRFAGVGARDDQCWEWDGTAWAQRGPAAGQRPIIYDASGQLVIIHELTPSTPTGSQGWRYVDDAGTLVPADGATMADIPQRLFQWIEHQGIVVGQGGKGTLGEDPMVVVIGGVRRLLSDGTCRMPKFRMPGDVAAISFYREDTRAAYSYWLTRAELEALPVATDVPIPDSPPVVVVPTPENPMALMAPNEMAAVQRAMAAHPEINTKDEATRGRVLDYACADANTREARKAWGRKARNADGSNLNTDVMAFRRPDGDVEYYDSIDGTTGAVSWGPSGPFKNGQNGYWTPAPAVDGGTTPTPTPNVHLYDGGEHDTDECDICHRSRFDPVHIIPESTVKHAYNGGEQDTGLCDICQKPVGDPIHNTAPTPQEPPGGTTSPGGTVSFDDDATRLLTQILDSCHAQEERQAEIVAAVQELKDAVGGASKNLLGEVIKNAPGILAGILPFLKGSAVKKPAAKRKRR